MISLIVAAAENGVIGRRNKMPWHMPADLKHFKETTTGHPIIMGRVTHESIGQALPGRTNIVVSSDKGYEAKDCKAATSVEEAIELAKNAPGSDEIFIIGGASIYEQALPLAGRLYLTKVHASVEGDKVFKYNPAEWNEISSEPHQANEKNQYNYSFTVLERKKKS